MNRALTPLLLASVFSGFLFSPASAAAQSSSVATAPPSVAQASAPSTWKRYGYDVDGFSAEFPSEPQAHPNDGNTGTRYSTSVQNGQIAYFVERADLPADLKKSTEEVFDSYVVGATNGTKSQVKTQKATSVRGYPGREFVLENETLIFDFRLIIVGKTLYQVLVVASKDLVPQAQTDRFLDSFQLIQRLDHAQPSAR